MLMLPFCCGAINHEADRVTVRRCPRESLAGDRSTGADAIVDHELLPQPLTELLRDDPRDGIAGAAGRGRDDEADNPVRPVGVRLWLRAGASPSRLAQISGLNCVVPVMLPPGFER